MELTWFVFALISTIVWSFGSITLKFVRLNYIKSAIGYIVIASPTALLGFIFLLFEPFTLPSPILIFYCALAVLFAFVAYWLYLIAIHKEEVSRITTLFGLQPLAVLMLATLFLGEVLSLNDYMAFILILAGSILISTQKIEKKVVLSKGILLTLISILLFSAQGIFLKLASEVNFSTMLAIRYTTYLSIIGLLFLLSKTVRKDVKEDLKQINKKKLMLIYLGDFLGMMGLMFSYLAIQRGPVSLVSLVQGTQSLFVLILAILLSIFIPRIIKENINKKTIILKLVSILLIVGGLYLMVI